jgi:hypothetical protein
VSKFRAAALLCALHAALLPASVHAQMHVARNVDVAPLEALPTGRFIGATHAFTEWQRGYGSPGEEQTWDVKAGVRVDVVRWRPRSGLVFGLGGELLANPYNAHRFNPRGVFLEPVIAVVHHGAGLDWQLAAFHRCRHDVDNIDPPNPDDVLADATRYKRVIILSGLQLAATTRDVSIGSRATGRLSARVEAYPVRFEDRRPANPRGPDWTHAAGSATLGVRSGVHVAGGSEAYVHGWSTLVLFNPSAGARRMQAAGRVELGARLGGTAGSAVVFGAVEHTFDDLSPPAPKAGLVVFVGVRFVDAAFR